MRPLTENAHERESLLKRAARYWIAMIRFDATRGPWRRRSQ